MIRIPEVVIQISIPKSVFGGEEVKFDLVIRIPEVLIRILISKSFFNSEKVKFGLMIRIPNVKAATKIEAALRQIKVFFSMFPMFSGFGYF